MLCDICRGFSQGCNIKDCIDPQNVHILNVYLIGEGEKCKDWLEAV